MYKICLQKAGGGGLSDHAPPSSLHLDNKPTHTIYHGQFSRDPVVDIQTSVVFI